MAPERHITDNDFHNITDYLKLQKRIGRKVQEVVTRSLTEGRAYNIEGEPLIIYAEKQFPVGYGQGNFKIVANESLLRELETHNILKQARGEQSATNR